jgi:ABC-2 type transport system ATP-binding protein
MRDLLCRLPAELGLTVFLSSHLLSEVEQIASHIGIIHAGRLLFQGALTELRAQQQAQLTIGVTAPEQAAQCLTKAGWAVRQREDGMLIVAADSPATTAKLNHLLVSQGIEVFHLARTQLSLEDIFLTLTDGNASERRAL